MQKFKRSMRFIVTIIFLLIIFVFLIKLEAEVAFFGDTVVTPLEKHLMAIIALLFVICTIIRIIVLPDFSYFINVLDNWVIFEMSEDDNRRIDKNFAIVNDFENGSLERGSFFM